MSLPVVNKKAPTFTLPASNGEKVKLADLSNKIVVLYFYPKNDTPGCTTQACGFRDGIKKIEKADAIVLGVSPDTVIKHNKFIDKYDLPFLLLSDEEHKVSEKYGVWVEKNMYGRKYMGIARTTFIIKDGKIEHVFNKVKPKEHLNDVLEVLKTIK
ncbi:MAG: peroxiredoxin Q/BCP [Candidatus Omnitrophota bacterium]|jgi:peroxiredoxin Q/BCP